MPGHPSGKLEKSLCSLCLLGHGQRATDETSSWSPAIASLDRVLFLYCLRLGASKEC